MKDKSSCPQCGGGPVTWKCMCEPMWRPSASIADTAGAKPIYQCMANDDDDNPTSRNLWLDVDKKAFDVMSIRSDVRARIVHLATPPAPSVAEQKLVDESNGAWDAFEKSPHADMSNRGDLWPVWKDAWNAASAPSVADAAISTKNIDVECTRVVDEDFWNLTYAPSVADAAGASEREQFERAATKINLGIQRQPADEKYADYLSLMTEKAWLVWQAARAKDSSHDETATAIQIMNSQRFEWITHDHDDRQAREDVRRITENMSVKSYSAMCRDIDESIKAWVLRENSASRSNDAPPSCE